MVLKRSIPIKISHILKEVPQTPKSARFSSFTPKKDLKIRKEAKGYCLQKNAYACICKAQELSFQQA